MALWYWERRHTTAAWLRPSWLAFGKQFSQACALESARNIFRRLAQRVVQRHSGAFSDKYCYGRIMRAGNSKMKGSVALVILSREIGPCGGSQTNGCAVPKRRHPMGGSLACGIRRIHGDIAGIQAGVLGKVIQNFLKGEHGRCIGLGECI